MRLGQKNPRTRRWAQRGTRPRATADLRTKSAYLFGAICPARGTGAAIVMPHADTEAMQHHLDEIARNRAPKAPAIGLLDQAGWPTTGKLRRPEPLSLLPLPPKSPELNPTENVWQFLRQNKFSNRIFEGLEAIVEALPSLEQPHRRPRPHHLDRHPPMGNHPPQLRAVGISRLPGDHLPLTRAGLPGLGYAARRALTADFPPRPRTLTSSRKKSAPL